MAILLRTTIAFFILVMTVACTSSKNNSETNGDGIEMVDALGDTIKLDGYPHRVVSLAPSLTELVFELGQDDKLVGVTQFCDYPAAALEITRVAGFNMVNLEAIVGSQPELIIASRGNAPQDLAALRRMGLPVFTFRVDSLPDLIDAAEILGSLLDAEGAAERVISSWETRIARITKVVESVPMDERPRVFFGGASEPVYSVGPGSYIHDMIQRAGGRNIFGDFASAWPRVDLETLVKRDPEVIVIGFHSGYVDTQTLLAELRASSGWRSLEAVRRERVYSIGDEIMRPGPRLMGAFEQLHSFLYADTASVASE
jgi:iron complex transport system substrate-binding protein